MKRINRRIFSEQLPEGLSYIVDAFDCSPKIRVYQGINRPVATVSMNGAVRMSRTSDRNTVLHHSIKAAAHAAKQ